MPSSLIITSLLFPSRTISKLKFFNSESTLWTIFKTRTIFARIDSFSLSPVIRCSSTLYSSAEALICLIFRGIREEYRSIKLCVSGSIYPGSVYLFSVNSRAASVKFSDKKTESDNTSRRQEICPVRNNPLYFRNVSKASKIASPLIDPKVSPSLPYKISPILILVLSINSDRACLALSFFCPSLELIRFIKESIFLSNPFFFRQLTSLLTAKSRWGTSVKIKPIMPITAQPIIQMGEESAGRPNPAIKTSE